MTMIREHCPCPGDLTLMAKPAKLASYNSLHSLTSSSQYLALPA